MIRLIRRCLRKHHHSPLLTFTLEIRVTGRRGNTAWYDPDEFQTPDSECETSTDVSNPYRNVRWTNKAQSHAELEEYSEEEPCEEAPTSDLNPDRPGDLQDPISRPPEASKTRTRTP